MPEVVPSRVVSFTSEDKAFPASNLLKGSSFSKWCCISGGSKQEAVELSFSEPVEISRLDIGNNGSAFIEVLVRRSASSDDSSVLLPSSSFMSPVDAKNGTNLNRVRVFSGDQFIKSIACQKWDLVKFVCSQPFNKTLQYGISFVFFHTPANVNPEADDKNIKVDNLLNDEESDSTQFKPGSLFQASRQTSCDKDNSQSKSSISDKLNALKHSANLIQNANTSSSLLVSRPVDHHNSSKASTSSHQSHARPSSVNTDIIRSPQSSRISKNKEGCKQSKTSHSLLQKPLSNVILTLSGYQNPLRSQIRDKALELGAKYRQDWGPDCTHLICAFPNTPKFNLVKGKGIIVSDKWITQCYETKSNVPWRSFRVGRAPSPPNTVTLSSTLNQSLNDDNDESQSPESKSPVHKTNLRLRGKKKSDDSDWRPASSDEDDNDDEDDGFQETDEDEDNGGEGSDEDLSDEPNRRRKRKIKADRKNLQKRRRSTTSDGSNAEKNVTTNDPEDENTDDEIQRVMTSSRNQLSVADEDEDEEAIKESLMNSLPDIFMNKNFFIHNKSIPDDEESLIKRLIVAFGGTLHQYMSNEVQYVITRSAWDVEFDNALSSNTDLIFIRPEWIFACDRSGQLEAYEQYQVTMNS